MHLGHGLSGIQNKMGILNSVFAHEAGTKGA